MYPNLVQLDALEDVPCLVLLGEPGLGKSVVVREHVTALRNNPATQHGVLSYDLKDFGSELSLARNLFDSTSFQSWAQGSGISELYLDSVDEGLIQVDTLAGFLVQELNKLDRNRLRLRLVCRPAVWPRSLQKELEHLWSNGVSVYRLAPLTRADVKLAVKSIGLPVNDVMEAIQRSSAGSFARKPLILKMLLQIYVTKGALPNSITELYRLGILALATESNASRQEKLKVGRLTPNQRVALCERIAAVTTFCNRRVVTIQSNGGIQEDKEVAGQNLEGIERFESGNLDVNAYTLREVLDTAFFGWREAGKAEWDHMSHAEYLAAAYCARHKVPVADLKRLVMTSVDGRTRVAPQLKETAAWISMMVQDFRSYLLRVDPLVLLGSDVSKLTTADRKVLAEEALNLADEELWNINTPRGQLDILQHPSLPEQLRPYLINRNKSVDVRRFAMDVIRDSRINLDSELLEIASDTTEALHLRSHAAFVLAEVGQETTKANLQQLLDTANDENDEIKGWCLTAVWPNHLTPTELFQHLKAPKNDHFGGAYRLFLYNLPESISNQLPPDAIPIALNWVKAQPEEQFPDALSQLQDAIILIAWNNVGTDDQITEGLARVVADRTTRFKHVLRGRNSDSLRMDFSTVTASDLTKRQALICALLREFVARGLDPVGLFRSRDRLVYEEDVSWLISERASFSQAESEAILKALSAAPRTPKVLNAISKGLRDKKLPQDFMSFVYVEFGSAEQKAQRSAYAQQLWYESRDERRRNRKLKPTPAERIAHDLAQIEAGKTEWWVSLTRDLTLTDTSTHFGDYGKPLTELPGWKTADSTTKQRILDAAHRFVIAHEPSPEKFVGQSTFPNSVIAGYEALSLLAELDGEFLTAQSAGFWSKWLPLLLWYPFTYQQPSDSTLINIAVTKARLDLPDAALLMTKGNQHDVSRCITKLETVWDRNLEDALAGAITCEGVNAHWARSAIEALASRKNEKVIQLLIAALSNTNEESCALDAAVSSTTILIRNVPERIWTTAWQRVLKDEAFGRKLIEALAGGRDLSFFSSLSEDQLTDLFIWTESHYPMSEDPKHEGAYSVTLRDEVANFRNAIPRHLASVGTTEAIRGLARARKSIGSADLECPANFVPVDVRQTGMGGAWYVTRKEVCSGTDREFVAAD
jgi:hypothetical protein